MLNMQQQGIGLVEVLVALLLLAVAVMGFSALQMTALKATDESVFSSQALVVMRGGSEMMRANPDGIAKFREALNQNATTFETISKDSCVGDGSTCTENQLAIRDALVLKNTAASASLSIAAIDCPNTNDLTCLIASWEDTTATQGDGSPNCIDNSGAYVNGSTCFVMEAY